MAASRVFRNGACWLAALVLSFGLLLPLPAGRAQDFAVDLALILAIDCSCSVDSREFALQTEGMGRAFLRDEVKRAIAQGHRQKIAVAVVQWSDDRNQIVSLPWTVIASDGDAEQLGRLLITMPRQLAEGGTSISAALRFSAPLFASAPLAAQWDPVADYGELVTARIYRNWRVPPTVPEGAVCKVRMAAALR